MTKIRQAPKKKKGVKKNIQSLEITKDIAKVKPGTKKKKPDKIVKKLKPERKKIAKNLPVEKKPLDVVEKAVTLPVQNDNSNPLEKLIEPNGIRKGQNPIIESNRFFYDIPKTNYFIILSILSIIIFMVAGYVFPATDEDIIHNKVIWTNDGNYDRGLFNQLYTSLAFTLGVFLLGYYIYSTFIKLNVKYWYLFEMGILLMFFFGLGKIGELVYNHVIFDIFKDLVLPVALMVLAFASYKIYKDLIGVI